MKRRVAELPLHGGSAPSWLFERMTELSAAITAAVVEEYGRREMLRRLSDPWWFQAFGCVLGFDWHSSGLTTVTCGALKEAFRRRGEDLGILVAGGKGGASRRTPREIAEAGERHGVSGGRELVRASRMSAKVDSAAVQDGFQVYHHSFFFLPDGTWSVVQQGMDGERGRARRYHWLGPSVDDFVEEPHAGIDDLAAGGAAGGSDARDPGRTGGGRSAAGRAADGRAGDLLNLVDRESEGNREACAGLVRRDPDRLSREILRLTEGPTLFAPDQHAVLPRDLDRDHLRRVLRDVHERHPGDFETLLGSEGVGASTVRSLSLVAEVVHDTPASRRDPAEREWADYSFAHGGKDGHPYPVDRPTYDRSIRVLEEAVREARMGRREKADALQRIADLDGERRDGARAGGAGGGARDDAGPGR